MFLFRTNNATEEFSKKVTCFEFLEIHSKPKVPTPEKRSNILEVAILAIKYKLPTTLALDIFYIGDK